ncbi:putative tetratricopeptide repeat protein 1 [Tothia fuscella]|uniref:Tetratricopeptide repeat protein 1 n=1 Tax=Tothia fuscella TaxID=1048955 RepID=A0A9P4NF81_9PEZI|nr:putative tetratricopeptide repeat protein 1 [Tothia fuscella]
MEDSPEAPTTNKLKPNDDEPTTSLRLPDKEEKDLLSKSNNIKINANTLFTKGSYSEAVTGYNSAIDTLPSYLDYELAVLKSNISACYIKLDEWKEATETATEALDSLERLDPSPEPIEKGKKGDSEAKEDGGKVGEVVEVDDTTAERIEALSRSGRSLDDVIKLRVKTLLRRAKARIELGTWSHLQGAQEDYQQLNKMPNLTPTDRNTVQTSLRSLNPRLEEAKQKEMADMMGKLKSLGNGLLKPFGLSTDNFNMAKDEKTGGYNLGFDQGKK